MSRKIELLNDVTGVQRFYLRQKCIVHYGKFVQLRGQGGKYQPISFGKKIRKRNPPKKKVKKKRKEEKSENTEIKRVKRGTAILKINFFSLK
jgi:hypothetical protein